MSAKRLQLSYSHLANQHSLAQFIVGSTTLKAKDLFALKLRCLRLPTSEHAHLFEQWLSNKPVSQLKRGAVNICHDGQLLFGSIEIDELSVNQSLEGLTPLALASQQAYEALFDAIDALQYPYLWRTWNYLAKINLVTYGVERYRQFNEGRQLGFASRSRTVLGHVPAACALGTLDGPLNIGFIAAKTPTVSIENPRQVSAYHYPSRYGAKSPTFSRAAIAMVDDQPLLFLSGTASIVGHETVHLGDVTAQTHESVNNIEAILASASGTKVPSQHAGVEVNKTWQLHDLDLRVYIRHTEDFESVQAVLQTRFLKSPAVQPVYVQMDICRDDLLVEIEGLGWRQ